MSPQFLTTSLQKVRSQLTRILWERTSRVDPLRGRDAVKWSPRLGSRFPAPAQSLHTHARNTRLCSSVAGSGAGFPRAHLGKEMYLVLRDFTLGNPRSTAPPEEVPVRVRVRVCVGRCGIHSFKAFAGLPVLAGRPGLSSCPFIPLFPTELSDAATSSSQP